jgi:hypothetical protein
LLLREWITTVIPSALSRRAVASPIPDVDPVTNATAFSIPAVSQTRRIRQLVGSPWHDPGHDGKPRPRSPSAAAANPRDARPEAIAVRAGCSGSPTPGCYGIWSGWKLHIRSRQVLQQDAVHDYEQAIAETQDGLHGDDFVQCGGEHGNRMSRRTGRGVRRPPAESGGRMPSLDINTCGGELLASLQPLPATVATEGWAPSLPIARDRRGAFGFDVRRHGGTGSRCELGDGECDPVLNRHGRLDARELARVLAPGGVPVTQRIGSRNDAELNDVLGASPVEVPGANSRDGAWRSGIRDPQGDRGVAPEFSATTIGT